MQKVDIRWRPSGGRGEYEHVPHDVLLERRIIVDAVSVENAKIATDVWGKIKDGKPRLRREHPNDRSILNLPQLISALALLPDSIREDQGKVILPLRHKGYVISSISFLVDLSVEGLAICMPQRMRILHDTGEIDLVERLQKIGNWLRSGTLSSVNADLAGSYIGLIQAGKASSDLRDIANRLLEGFREDAAAELEINSPSDNFSAEPTSTPSASVSVDAISADETKRKLSAHYRIDRSRKIRQAKVEEFESRHGAIYCENCRFDFAHKYGERGVGFIEVHHKVPLAALLPNTITFLSDLLLLCSNCHRMVHRRRPHLDPDTLRRITSHA